MSAMFSLFPRGRTALQRYGRRKVVATLVTFAVAWVWLSFFATDLRDSLRGFGTRTPGAAFRERLRGETVQALAVVEQVLPDSASAAGVVRRAQLRTVDGHPFMLHLAREKDTLPATGDTVRVRGRYDFGLRGGTVTVAGDGWVRPPG